MKIRGKISLWYWLLLIGVNALLVLGFVYGSIDKVIAAIVFVICNIILIPIIVRNYVLVTNELIYIFFGFSKDSMKILEIEEVSDLGNSNNRVLNNIYIKGKRKEILLIVKNKEALIKELIKINPNIFVNLAG